MMNQMEKARVEKEKAERQASRERKAKATRIAKTYINEFGYYKTYEICDDFINDSESDEDTVKLWELVKEMVEKKDEMG